MFHSVIMSKGLKMAHILIHVKASRCTRAWRNVGLGVVQRAFKRMKIFGVCDWTGASAGQHTDR